MIPFHCFDVVHIVRHRQSIFRYIYAGKTFDKIETVNKPVLIKRGRTRWRDWGVRTTQLLDTGHRFKSSAKS